MPKFKKIPPGIEMEPKSSVRYVTRYRGDGTDGWRYQRSTPEGIEPAIYFTVKEYGDLRSALDAAEAYSIAHNKGTLKRFAHGWCSRNQFGLCGVTIDRSSPARRGLSYYWSAHWSEGESGQVRRRFSIMDYGYSGAFLNAAYERIRAVGGQPGLDPHNPPEPPEIVAKWMADRGIK